MAITSKPRVLIACEFSGVVREAFRLQGYDAWSCDLLPSEIRGQHIEGDVRKVLDWNWALMVAHPPCTHLASSGARWFKDKTEVRLIKRFTFLPIGRNAKPTKPRTGCVLAIFRPPGEL